MEERNLNHEMEARMDVEEPTYRYPSALIPNHVQADPAPGARNPTCLSGAAYKAASNFPPHVE